MMKNCVILTGAGISAESGLKTFRDSDGLWEGYDVQQVATPGGWGRNPALVLDFYNMRRRDVLSAQPNAAHLGLAKLENFFDVRIITQNIDDLHERAGSSHVLHLHGEIFKMRSELNESIVYDIRTDIGMGYLAEDGGQFRPHIVWFEEPVPLIIQAERLVRSADVFVIIGTSLAVYPAAGLIHAAAKEIPKCIVDKSIPPITGITNRFRIEKPATQGITDLTDYLLSL